MRPVLFLSLAAKYRDNMPTPEELARQNIDKRLVACGWTVQDLSGLNLHAGPGVADYILFVDRKAVGVAEAKPEGTGLSEQR